MLYLGCKQLYKFVVRKNCLENDLEYRISRDSHNHTRYTKKSTNNQSDNKYLQRTGFHRVGEYNRLTENIIYKLSKEETYQYIEGFWKDNTLQVGIHKIGDSEHRDDHRTYHRSHVRNQIEQRTEKSNNQRILDPKDKQDNSKQDKDHT